MLNLWGHYGFRGVAFVILALFVLLRIGQLLFQHRQLKRERLRANYAGQAVVGAVLSFGALVLCVPRLVGLLPEELGLPRDSGEAAIASVTSVTKGPQLPRLAKGFVGVLEPAQGAIVSNDWKTLAAILFEARRKGTAHVPDTTLLLDKFGKQLQKEYFLSARAAVDRGELPLAREYLTYAVELPADDGEAFMLRASITPADEWKSAAHDLENASRKPTPGLRAIEARLKLRREHGDTRGALEDVDVILHAQPSNVALLALRGKLRFTLGVALEGAIADLTSAVNAEPANVGYRIDLAQALLAKNDDPSTKLALAELDRALKDDPDNFQGCHARGQARFALHRLSEAMADASKAIQLDGKSSEAYFLRGRIRAELDQGIAARNDFDQAIKLDPKNRKAVFWRGIMTRERDPRAALADFNRAIELDPDGWAHYYRGECLLLLGKREDAESALSDALNLTSDEKLIKLVQESLTRARKRR